MVDTVEILAQVESHAMSSGLFETVNLHEPKKKPGNHLTAAVWVQSVAPDPEASGLASTSAVFVFNLRVFTNMLQEPQDAIDPKMLAAVDRMMTLYSGDFTLGGNVMGIDLLGMAGVPLSADAGYITQDGTLYRVMTITLPVLVANAWTQTA